jgi:predicted transposase YdaD
MSFDAALKELLEESPAAWPWLVGAPARDVAVIDSDIATVTGAADKVLHVRDEPPWIHHVEFQAGPDTTLPRRGNVYNAILEHRHGLPVRSSFVLLSRKANLAVINGSYECRLPGHERPYRVFEYDVIRVWELPPERFLAGGLSLIPLAPISAVTETDVRNVIDAMKRRLQPQPEAHAGKLWAATKILMGLCYDEALVENLLAGVPGMEESVTYQAIVREGETRGLVKGRKEGAAAALHKILLLQGKNRFHKAPGARIKGAIEAIRDPNELERLAVRVLSVRSWEELLSLPERPKRRKS